MLHVFVVEQPASNSGKRHHADLRAIPHVSAWGGFRVEEGEELYQPCPPQEVQGGSPMDYGQIAGWCVTVRKYMQ